MTTTMPETDVDTGLTVLDETQESTGTDIPKKRHIVNPAMNVEFQNKYGRCEDAQEIVDVARVRGVEITALCGEKFIPTRNPAGLETCNACMDIAGQIMGEG